MIHDRSLNSITLASGSSLIGGILIGSSPMLASAWIVGLVIALAGGTAALWFHPDPREIAISWNNQFGEPEERDSR